MVISDLNIICLKQKEIKLFESDKIGIDFFNLNSNKNSLYGDHWKFLTALKGIWYSLYPISRDSKKYDYNAGFFNINSDKASKTKYHISLSNIDIELLTELLDYYLQHSPIKQICFLVRLDWKQENVIYGTINKKEFIKKVCNEELYFNEAYIIQE